MRRALCCLLVSCVAACGPAEDAPRVDVPIRDAVGPVDVREWNLGAAGLAWITAAEFGEPLRACAIGDVDAARPGNEIVAVGVDGGVHLVAFAEGGWTTRRLARTPGALFDVALGELDPARPGLEIVVTGVAEGAVGAADAEGLAQVLFFDGADWTMRELARAPAPLTAALIADLDPDLPGNEVLLAGEDGRVTVLALGTDGFQPIVSMNLPGAARGAVFHQEGAVVACADGTLVWVRREGPNHWSTVNLAQREVGAAAAASDDERLLVAREDGTLEMVQGLIGRAIFSEDQALTGAVLANIDPVAPGLEAASAGLGGRVAILLHRGGSRWTASVAFDDGAPLRALSAGPLTSLGAGVFLVTGGDSGRLTVIGKAPEVPAAGAVPETVPGG